MKQTIISILLISLICSIQAQNGVSPDAYIQQYNRHTIYLKKGGFEKNGERIPYGSLKKNLKKELSASALALPEYTRSRKNLWVAVGCNIVSAAFVFSSARSDKYRKPLNYVGLGFNLLSIPFKIKSQNQLNRAVWFYNREAIGRQ